MPAPLPLDRAAIVTLVGNFYADVRRDPRLGPIFEASLGQDWDAHLARLADFWCSVALGSSQFKGNVLAKHRALEGIDADHFRRWLALFERHVAALFEPATSAELMRVARRIGAGLESATGARRPPPR